MNRKERRRAPRSHSSVPLDLYDPRGEAIIGEGRFVNVSLTGSLLESRQPFPLRKYLRLRVQTPGRRPFEFAGRIVWRKKKSSLFNYGIKFQPVSVLRALFRNPVSLKEVA